MALLDPTQPNAATAPQEVGSQLESLLVKQLLRSSGVFKGGSTAGSAQVQALFADTLADCISKSSKLGMATAVEQQLAAKVTATPTPGVAASVASPIADASAHVSSGYGQRIDPIDGTLREHHGVDIAAKAGTPILAAGDGVVVSAGVRGGYGQAVEVKHASGVTTLYAHASQLLVQPGDHVTQGQAIATVGQTGRATGPHLHFEVRQGGKPLNPTRALSVYSRRADE